MMIRRNYEYFPELVRKIGLGPEIIDDLSDFPVRRDSAQVALHEPASRLFRIAESFLDRGAIVGLHLFEDGLLLIFVEILDEGDRIVGLHLARQVGDLLRLHFVEEIFSDVIVELSENVRADDSGKRLDQALSLVPPGKLDQVGHVCRVKRLNEPTRRFIVADLDRVQDFVDEFGTEPIFFVDRRLRLLLRGGGGDVLALAHAM